MSYLSSDTVAANIKELRELANYAFYMLRGHANEDDPLEVTLTEKDTQIINLIEAEINRQLIQPEDIRLAIEDLSRIPELLTDHLGYCDWHNIASAVNTATAVLSDQNRARTIGQNKCLAPERIAFAKMQFRVCLGNGNPPFKFDEATLTTALAALDAVRWRDPAVDFAADIRLLIDAEIARQSVMDEATENAIEDFGTVLKKTKGVMTNEH